MITAASTVETRSLPRSRPAIVLLTIAVLTGAFYFIEHRNAEVSDLEAFTVTGDEMADKAAEGDIGRRVAFPAIGLFGALLLVRRDGWRLGLQSRLAWLLLGCLAWSMASVLWSVDPSLTVRRLSVLLLCTVGALGIARQVTLREVCWIALAGTSLLVANSVRIEIALGTFLPFSADYRFAGTLHPNAQAPYCAMMALAAAFLASGARRGRVLLWALCLIGAVLLVLTKSRTVCASVVIGLLAYGLLTAPWTKRVMVGAAILCAGCTLALAGSLLGWDIEGQAANVALIGRHEEADSLSGRVPLWAALVPYVQERLLLGHGYQTFWSPDRIDRFSQAFEWTVPDGHSAYLDTLLDLGAAGALLGVLAVIASVHGVARGYVASGDLGCAFLFAMLTCRSLHAFLESALAVPTSFVPFILGCGVVHVAFCTDPSQPLSAKESAKELSR